MSIVNPLNFAKAEIKLPIDNIAIQDYIDKHEPIILTKILGYNLYKDFLAGIVASNAVFLELRDGAEFTDYSGYLQKYNGIVEIIVAYVFVKIIADKQNYPTDSGVKISGIENTENYSPRYKQVFTNNEMVDSIAVMNEFIIMKNAISANTFENYFPEIQEKSTIFNI